MPSALATRRASSTASVPQHEPKRAEASAASCHGQTRIVTPTTSWPASVSSAAATEESTPPLIPTTTRSADMESVSRAKQSREALELLGVGVDDLDPALPLAPHHTDARHERALQGVLHGGELGGAAALLGTSGPALGRRADAVPGRAHRPVVDEDVVAELELLGRRGQREQGASVAHRQAPGPQVLLDGQGESQQAERVGDRAPVLSDPLRQLFLSPAELSQQPVERFALFHRIEVF